uniref:Uncharacterized protein n=1 Tax=Romanomermis culicivorax TaxID=13658 RepID=A0A915I6B1_ROMCU
MPDAGRRTNQLGNGKDDLDLEQIVVEVAAVATLNIPSPLSLTDNQGPSVLRKPIRVAQLFSKSYAVSRT